MMSLTLLALLPLLFPLVTAQYSPGQFSMNATVSKSNPQYGGCIVLAQLTKQTPPLIQAMYPICPEGTPEPTIPTEGAAVNWPIAGNAGDGDGAGSQLAIYGNVSHFEDRTDVFMGKATCVMVLSADQVQYLLKRSLTWNNDLQELWDNTGNGFIIGDNGTMTCGQNEDLLPAALFLPCPYMAAPNNTAWSDSLTIKMPTDVVESVDTVVADSDNTNDVASNDVSAIVIDSSTSSWSASASASWSASASASSSTSDPVGGALVGFLDNSTSASSSHDTSGSSVSASTVSAIVVVGSTDSSAPTGDCTPVTVTEVRTTTVTAGVQGRGYRGVRYA